MNLKVPQLEGNGIFVAPFFLVLFVFFLPVSPTLKSVFLGCYLGAVVLTPGYRNLLSYSYNTLWGRAALCLFVFCFIGCMWSPAPYSLSFSVVGKYFKLMYLPILAVGFIHPKVRILCINTYLASIALTCILSLLKSKNIFLTGDAGAIFYNHIATGFIVAFGSYLAGLMIFKYKGWLRFGYTILMLLTSYQILFINTGRTGYVVYFILMALLFLQKLSLRKATVGILIFSSLLVIVYSQSPVLRERINDLRNDISSLQAHNENNSLGYRMQFHHYAKVLLEKNPVTGIGTGGFKFSFSQDNPVPAWGPGLTDPHSQYWMTLAEQGLTGLMFLLFFFCSLFITSFRLSETRPILLGILLAFCIGSFSDTILCYSTAGYILLVMSALSFGELIQQYAVQVARVKKFSQQDNITSVNTISI
jgi:O-antigen ligase